MENKQQQEKLSFFQVLASVFAAAIGVQNHRTLKRDFTQGDVAQFIAAGALFTLVFIITVITVVNLVLA